MGLFRTASIAMGMCLAAAVPASAQWGGEADASGQVSAGGGGGGGGGAVASRGSSGTRLAMQVRLDAFNLFGVQEGITVTGDTLAPAAFVPIVTPGLRLLDARLFIGLGFGFYGLGVSECGGDGCDAEEDTTTVSGWSINPLASFDLLSDDWGALHLLAWLNFATLNSITREEIRPGTTDTTEIDGQFWWGANVGAGVRGKISEGLAIGGELGWGFATYTDDGNRSGDADDTSVFVHGIFGILLFEASVGL